MFRTLLYLAGIIIINYSLFITHCHAQWVQQNLPYNATVVDVHFFNANTGLVKQSSPSKYLRTTDGGNNWTNLNDTNYVNEFWFVNDSIGYTIAYYLGTYYVSKTTNGGLNWTQKFSSGEVLWEASFINKDTGWVCGGKGIGKIWRTTNGGDNFTLQYQTTQVDAIRRLFFLKEKVNGSYKGWWSTSQVLKITTDGGQNWEATIILAELDMVYKMEFINQDTGFMTISSSQRMFYKTTNGGINWNGTHINFPSITPSSIVSDFNIFNNGNTIYAIGGTKTGINPQRTGIVYKSTNGGQSFGYQNVDTITFLIFPYEKLNFINENTGWVFRRQFGYKTTNGGGTIVSIGKEQLTISTNYELYQNYPNPFNPETNFKFEIPDFGYVTLKIYDINGKLIETLIDKNLNKGSYNVRWSAKNLSSGVYYYTLQITPQNTAKIFSKTLKMIYLK